MTMIRHNTSPTVCTEETAGASSADEDDKLQQAVCRKTLRRMSTGSSVISEGRTILDDGFNRVVSTDIEEGPQLGRGCFSNVREVKSQRSLHSLHSQRSLQQSLHSQRSLQIEGSGEDEEGLSSRRGSLKSQVSTEFDSATDQPSRSYYYAVKKLREDLSESNRMSGAIDLAVEAQFLTSLSHKNIVSLEGVGDNPGSKEFFIIVEKLDRTLATEIKGWKHQQKYIKEGKIPCPRNKSVKDMIHEQLDSILLHAYDLSSALAYLHTKNLLFRDLKPDNVGFTFNNDLKIFDFGLAKELRLERQVGPDKYLGSIAGTRRYMSPEVMKGIPYGLPADVYSFSILVWEMLHFEKPFDNAANLKALEKSVLVWKKRPKFSKYCPKEVKTLLSDGWLHEPSRRPDMRKVHRTLGDYLISKRKLVARS